MGSIIKARDLLRRPDRLGRRGQSRIAEMLEARAGARGAEERRRSLALACRLAALIVEDSVERDPAVLDRIYERAIRGMEPKTPISIRVHPTDRSASRIDGIAREAGFEVIDDPGVGRGGCRVSWEGAEIDASLAALEATLLEAAGETG